MNPIMLSSSLRVHARSTFSPTPEGLSSGSMFSEILSVSDLISLPVACAYTIRPTDSADPTEATWEILGWTVDNGAADSPGVYPDGSEAPSLVKLLGIVIKPGPVVNAAPTVSLTVAGLFDSLEEFALPPISAGGVIVWLPGGSVEDAPTVSELVITSNGFQYFQVMLFGTDA